MTPNFTSERGIINAQFQPGICHSNGTTSIVKITIMAIQAKQIINDSLNHCQMRGTTHVGKGGSPVSKGQSMMVRGTRIGTRTLNPERRKLDFFTRWSPHPRISKRPWLSDIMRRACEKLTCHTRTDVPTERSIVGYSCHQRRINYEYKTNGKTERKTLSVSQQQFGSHNPSKK